MLSLLTEMNKILNLNKPSFIHIIIQKSLQQVIAQEQFFQKSM